MKSKKLKRILALVLCMALLLSTGLSALASTEGAAETPVPEVTDNQEPQAASVEGEEETTAGETTPTETTTTESQEQQPEVPAEANTDNAPETTEAPETKGTESVSGIKDLVGGTETQTEPEVVSEAVELKQEFTDANGKVVQRVTANVPEGAFTAKASEVTMEVNYLDEAAENRIKEMMTKQLPENDILGDYILYDIKFKVNGTVTEPQKAIAITLEGSGLHIEDTKKANTFYIDPADPKTANDKEEIIEITQKNEMIENLQKAGQSTENIDEYDLSEISVNADGVAEKILMEGRISTIYGCYVEKTPEPVQTLNYEDDDVQVRVDAYTENAIPAGAELRVVPIKPNDKDTKDQYKEVEEQLNKKAENEEYDIAGFLAYDITFVNENGEEVEPNGYVKVTMEYLKEAIPEEVNVAEDAELDVTVMHLEENGKGDVKAVVDMVADMDKEAAVETTEDVKVKKAEFVTDSFSYFTVAWKYKDKNYNVKVYLYELGGDKLNTNSRPIEYNTKPFNNADNIALSELADALSEYIPKGYFYVEGRLDKRDGQKASRISYNNNGKDDKVWHYYYNGQWRQWTDDDEEPKVYLFYTKDRLSTVETLDNNSAGITMKMIDLKGFDAEGNLSPDKGNTYIGTDAKNKIKIGGGYGQGNIKQGLLKRTLSNNGYPVTTGLESLGGEKDKNLSTLFSQASVVNKLFPKSTYDSTGYYEYSSFENYAYLNANGNFTVYNQIGTPSDLGNYFYQRGNFMPYNEIKDGAPSTNTNQYDENGKLLTGGRKGERLYKTQGENNYYFGMTMEASFLQPKDGKTSSKEDMVFEFNGDDDLWIYIDNVLVLDIGGIHDAHSGFINFSTGIIGVYDCNTGQTPELDTTTIKAMFKAAGVFPDGSKWDEEKVANYFSGNTFIDYRFHDFKMFYMERGAAASNLHIKFNLQTIPEGQIEVRKQLSNTDKEAYANEEFEFQVYVQEQKKNPSNENPEYTDVYVPLTSALLQKENITAKLKGSDTPITFDADGSFYLKSDQSAIFSGLKANRKYYVKEIGVNPSEYDQVIITSTTVTGYDNDKREIEQLKDVVSSSDTVENRPLVVFTNNCSRENSRELRITKLMKNSHDTTDTFSFKIQLTNQNNELVNYADGDYYLKDADGYYYYYNKNNQLVRNVGKAEDDRPSIVCGKTDSNGIVRNISVGYTVAIAKILSGTSFLVQEVDLDTNQYFPPIKEVVSGTCDMPQVKDSDGMIALGKDAQVNITNDKRANILKIKKVDSENPTKTLAGAVFELQKQNGGQFVPVKKEGKNWQITTKDNGIASFDDLENGRYKVVEVTAPEGYVLDTQNNSFEIDLPYTKTEPADSSITVDESNKLDNGTYCLITKTVLNQRRTWEIIKRSSSDSALILPDARFELRPVKIGGTTYYGKSQSDGKLIWYKDKNYTENGKVPESNIIPDTYTLHETSAPVGYALSTEVWTITIGTNGSWISATGILDSKNQTEKNNKVTCYFENTPLYELPSTGGTGIFWYMIGGVLLMMAGVLILYKNKYRGVLESK